MTTPTAALVEEAEKITEGVPADWTACSCNKCGLVWALGEMHIATVELETGESDCAQPSPEQRRRIMDFMARSRSMIPELASALRRAEAERDAQHAEVLRLTGERDALQEACDRKALQDRQAVQYIMSLRDSKILRLQERVATLELLRRGGK